MEELSTDDDIRTRWGLAPKRWTLGIWQVKAAAERPVTDWNRIQICGFAVGVNDFGFTERTIGTPLKKERRPRVERRGAQFDNEKRPIKIRGRSERNGDERGNGKGEGDRKDGRTKCEIPGLLLCTSMFPLSNERTSLDDLDNQLSLGDNIEMPTLSEMSDESSDEEAGLPTSLSAIDADDAVNHCDMCNRSLDADDKDSRAFRCYNCELAVQCETCCSARHISSTRIDHMLQEWDHEAQAWSKQQETAAFMSTMTKACSCCEIELATQYRAFQDGGALIWWEGHWAVTTLADEGLVVNLGHGGEACLYPSGPVVGLTVLTMRGIHRVNVRFCGCGKYESSDEGEWRQILANGWHRATLLHRRVCATFKIMSRAVERGLAV
ncbi:hypothetical protein DFH06DRAFT_1130231 [Mycena polygramma]|nr:hypothetical protein DFH06DRAFT_1130231 [Mycena polygramma]